MKDGAYLIDNNILIRWVKPDDRDYPLLNRIIENDRDFSRYSEVQAWHPQSLSATMRS